MPQFYVNLEGQRISLKGTHGGRGATAAAAAWRRDFRDAQRKGKQKLIALKIEALMEPIFFEVSRSLNDNAVLAQRVAQNRAPVRRVFTGGRATFRTLTLKERKETQALANLLTPGSDKYHISHRVLTHPNRANVWRVSERDRRVEVDDLGIPHLENPAARFALNAEGRRAMRGFDVEKIYYDDELVALRDKGYGAISFSGFQGHIGGNLRKSIKINQASTEEHDRAIFTVRAGGPTAPYAKFMEFGTRYVAARPYLRPALKHVEGRLAEHMRARLLRRFGRRG